MAAHLQNIGKVTGHLEKRRDYWHMVVSWTMPTGGRKRQSKSTGLPSKNNKKRAEEMLEEFIRQVQKNLYPNGISVGSGSKMLFADFIRFIWLVEKEQVGDLRMTTLSCYETAVIANVEPYFRERKITLLDLRAEDIETYYAFRLQSVKATTVHKDHIVLTAAVKLAVKKNLIPHNMMSEVKRPKKKRFRASFFTESEIIRLFEIVEGHDLELPIMFGAFYGLRRSEIVGLRWESINFEAKTITIEHTVTQTSFHGKQVICAEDICKTKSSLRTLPLVPAFQKKLMEVKLTQQQNQKYFGRAYNKMGTEYVCTDPLGNLVKPGYITEAFPRFLEEHGFRRIRFHDLRHSCASLLLANDVPLIKVKEWLGHSEIGVTADIYGHLEFKSKLASAEAMNWIHETSLGKPSDCEETL